MPLVVDTKYVLVTPNGYSPELACRLAWDKEEPLLAYIGFEDLSGGPTVVWAISRDLLFSPQHPGEVHGLMDVKVARDPNTPRILDLELSAQGARTSRSQLDWTVVSGFLATTYRMVPPAQEDTLVRRDLDRWLRSLPGLTEAEIEEPTR